MNEAMKNDNAFRKPLMVRIWGMLPYVVVLLLLVMMAGLGVTCKRRQQTLEERSAATQTSQTPANVVTLALAPTHIRDRINLPAVTEPWISLQVKAEVAGSIVEKKVQEGDTVTKGQVLVVIEERDYRNAFLSAKATFENARLTYERTGKLYEQQLATKSQMDAASAQLESARAAMDNAALQLDRCRIRAAFSGSVDRVSVEEGQYLNVGEPVVELLRVDRLKVVVGIPESDVAAVRNVSVFNITFDALGGKTVQGTRHFLSKTTDTAARLYDLKLAVENPDGEILPDMFARVDIVKREVPGALVVPRYALIDREDAAYVCIVSDGLVRILPVTTGITEGWKVAVTHGLSFGDQVVVMGHRNLEEGQAVNVMRSADSIEAVSQ